MKIKDNDWYDEKIESIKERKKNGDLTIFKN